MTAVSSLAPGLILTRPGRSCYLTSLSARNLFLRLNPLDGVKKTAGPCEAAPECDAALRW